MRNYLRRVSKKAIRTSCRPLSREPRLSTLRLEQLEDRLTPSSVLPFSQPPVLDLLPAYASDRINVVMKSPVGSTAAAEVLASSPYAQAVEYLGLGIYSVHLKAGVSPLTAVAYYSTRPYAVTASVDNYVSIQRDPNDPQYSSQWDMTKIGAPTAWDVITGTPKFVVGVVDTGIDYNHQDLFMNIWINNAEIPTSIRNTLVDTDGDGVITFWDLNRSNNAGKVADNNGNGVIDPSDIFRSTSQGGWLDGVDQDSNGYVDDLFGWDFANNDNDPMDDNNHGTHVAGTIGAVGNNGVGVTGINWSISLMALKFLDSTGYGLVSRAVMAIDYATNKGVKLTNHSWGGANYSASLAAAISRARDAGHIIVAAAGNSGQNLDSSPQYPASYSTSYDNVITVASVNSSDQLASSSNYGANTVTLAAPGVSILSTVRNNGYSYFSGTSMAAPHVTGAIALYWASNPNLSYTQVIDKLKASVDPISGLSGKVLTGGRLNVGKMFDSTTPSGPKVIDAQWSGLEPFTLDRLRVTFDKAIKVDTFTSGDIVSFVGPKGSINTSYQVSAVSGSGNKVFDITFGVQRGAGSYQLVFGPQIEDEGGNRMNQDGDGVNGEDPGDRYTASVVLGESGPKVVDAQWSGLEPFTLDRLRVTFDKAIKVDTFTSGDIVSFVGPKGSINTSYQVSAVSGSGNKVFDITFGVQRGAGSYQLVFGPQIEDEGGNRMNQDGDGVNGEDPGDRYTASVVLGESGPKVVDAQWSGLEPFTLDRLRVTFDKAIKVDTFTSGDIVSFVGPKGSINTSYQVSAVSGSGNKVFDITFGVQRGAGSYQLVFGPQIEDEGGNRMNQDGDGVNGEDPGDRYTASVVLGESGPKVVDAQWSGLEPFTLDRLRVTFDKAIKVDTFTSGDIVSFVGPKGSINTSYQVSAVSGSGNKVFDITFGVQRGAGSYQLVFGPQIEDEGGNRMNQDGDGVNGEDPGDRYTASVVLGESGPKVVDAQWSGLEPFTLDRLRVTFDKAIKVDTFTSGDIVSFVGPNGSISTSYQITPVSGGGNKVFDITFGVQRGAGSYQLVFGPQIEDEGGNRMNQDGDGVNGEDPGDRYTASVVLGESGPKVVDAQWSGLEPFTLDRLRVTFDKAIKVDTFTSADIVSFVGPKGSISTSYQITPVFGGGNKVFDIVFGVQRGAGSYQLVLGPQIEDEGGNRMNQDGDGVNGEDPGDRYTASVVLGESGPKVVDAQWSGLEPFTLDRLRVTFDKAIKVDTFTSGDIVSFVGPNGSISTSYQITPVSGGGNKVFDITFGVQRGAGSYQLVLGPQIEDEGGNRMNQDGDGVNGEDPGDRYTASVVLGESGPKVVDAHFRGSSPRTFDSVRLTFSAPIKPSSFTADDIIEFTGPNGIISTSYTIVPVSGSNDTQFDILFTKQNKQGTYKITVGPFIEDNLGNNMNQNGDQVNGQVPDDRYSFEQYLDTSVTKRYDIWKINRPIRDYRVTRSVITITEAITVNDLSVRVNLNHTATGDLRIRLIGPQNQSVVLFNHYGKNGDNLRNTWFSDNANVGIYQGRPSYNGIFKPVQSLSLFYNNLAAGKWILEVRDTKNGNIGKLLSWSLVLKGTMEDSEGGGMGGMMSLLDDSSGTWPMYYLPPPSSNADHDGQWDWANPIRVG